MLGTFGLEIDAARVTCDEDKPCISTLKHHYRRITSDWMTAVNDSGERKAARKGTPATELDQIGAPQPLTE
jgi:hypothetical protein